MQHFLWITSLSLQIGLVARLFIISPKRYWWFIAYLMTASSGTLYLLSLSLYSTSYAVAWIIVQVASLSLLYAAALEIYGHLAQHFVGLNREERIVAYLRRILNAIMALSLLACIALTVFDARAMLEKQALSVATALSAAVLLKRIATSTLAVFLAGSSLYFSRFRVTFQPNLRIHGLLFTAWMTVSAAALFWRNLDMRRIDSINVAFLSASIVIFSIWIGALKQAGESIPIRVSISDGSAQADREILISFLRRLTRQR